MRLRRFLQTLFGITSRVWRSRFKVGTASSPVPPFARNCWPPPAARTLGLGGDLPGRDSGLRFTNLLQVPSTSRLTPGQDAWTPELMLRGSADVASISESAGWRLQAGPDR